MSSTATATATMTMARWTEAAVQMGLAEILGVTLRGTPKAAPSRSLAAAARKDLAGTEEDPRTSDRLLARLREADAPFRLLRHEPTRTSAESAAIRGVPLASGAKAMLMRSAAAEGDASAPSHYLCVMSAVRRLDIKAFRKTFGKKCKLVPAADEVRAVTGCIPGAVPPFGSLFEGGSVQTVVDRSLLTQGPTINFNAGLRTLSVCDLPTEAFLRLEAGHVVAEFTEEAPGDDGETDVRDA